jgi:hypothetical protein
MSCTIEDCRGEFYARGWCHKHYERWRRHGSTDDPRSPEARFWAMVDRAGECWRWLGALKSSGYGALSVAGRTVYAHRYSLELQRGEPIPAGMEVDHKCHTPTCVRPSHLRLATSGQNGQNRQGAQRNNSTGVRGVVHFKGRYRAQFQVAGEYFHVGLFDTLSEAEAAVSSARREHMTHSEMDKVR